MKQNNFKPKYKFVKYKDEDNKFDVSQVVHFVDTEDLNTLLEEFELFIRACGFCPKGALEFTDEER